MFDEVSLHQVIGLRGVEAEEHVDLVEVTCVGWMGWEVSVSVLVSE